MTGLAGVFLALTPLGTSFEREVGLRWLFQLRGPISPPSEPLVVAINEQTAKALSLPRLPRDWPRSTHARLVDVLARRGASVIVFDLSFDRPKRAEDDATFAQSVAAAGRVVLIERLEGKRQPLLDSGARPKGWVWMERLIPPMPELAVAARGLGPFPLPKVQEAVFRFWSFKSSVGGAPTIPAVAMQLYVLDHYDHWRELLIQAGIGDSGKLPARATDLEDAESLRALMKMTRAAFQADPGLVRRVVALADAAASPRGPGYDPAILKALARLYAGDEHQYLNFYGPPGSIPTVPYEVALSENPPDAYRSVLDLEGRVVFVGFSDLYDPGQPDRFYTVFTGDDGVDLSGVEIMASAFANLLSDRVISPTTAIETAVIVLLFGLIMGFALYALPAMASVPLALVATGGYAAGAQIAFNAGNLWLPLATPVLLQLPVAMVTGLLGQYLFERSQKRQFSEAISYYLPENVVRDLTEHGLDPSTINKVVYGTCLATDMSGFTTISERMAPDELATFMNDYFDTLAAPLKRHDVDVTEFHADTIMCAWTAPERNTSARRNAVQAAMDVIGAVHEFNAHRRDISLYPRIGLDDGNFYLGHAGGGGRMSFSILGDCANTAARLESLNKQIGTHILASESVVEDLDGLPLRHLGRFQLVGKTEPVGVVEILIGSEAENSYQVLCDRFHEAHRAFSNGQWAPAGDLFDAILRDFPDDGPTKFYVERSRTFAADPPLSDDPSVIVLDAK